MPNRAGGLDVIRIDWERGVSPYSPRIIERGTRRIAEHFALDPETRLQRKAPLEEEWQAIRSLATKAVTEYFFGKCAYCESAIGLSSPVEVDHFRPKFGASDLSGEGSLDHYCWLTLEWTNHYAACPACNRAKRSMFPVDGERVGFQGDLSAEPAMLIDPCHEEPSEHLFFADDGHVRALSDRGEVTIKVFNLNRTPLVEARRRVYQRVELERRAGNPTAVTQMTARGEPYVAVALAALRALDSASELPEAGFAVPEEMRSADRVISEDAESFRLSARALREVEISNFGLVREMRIALPEPGGDQAPWLMLLGENASGKSTVLRAIGLALAGAQAASRYTQPDRVVSRGAEDGFVRLHFWDKEAVTELRFDCHDRDFGGNPGPSAIVLGYGALRYPGSARRPLVAAEGFARLGPLLRPVARIPHPGRWFASLGDGEFAVAARCLRDLLPIAEDGDVVRRGRTVALRIGGANLPLEALSSGYQTMVGVSADIMRLLFQRWQTLESAAGIVLIDEIDAHLHPRWKMRIVRSLRTAFPQVQFIASTHDPLVLRGVRDGEVAVLRRDPATGAAIQQGLPPIEGMSVDQILTSRHFGLDSTLDPADEAKLAELYHLQSLPREGDVDERIAALSAEIGDKVAIGRSRSERLMLKAADTLFADDPAFAEDEGPVPLSDATIGRLQAVIDRSAGSVG